MNRPDHGCPPDRLQPVSDDNWALIGILQECKTYRDAHPESHHRVQWFGFHPVRVPEAMPVVIYASRGRATQSRSPK